MSVRPSVRKRVLLSSRSPDTGTSTRPEYEKKEKERHSVSEAICTVSEVPKRRKLFFFLLLKGEPKGPRKSP